MTLYFVPQNQQFSFPIDVCIMLMEYKLWEWEKKRIFFLKMSKLLWTLTV